MCHIDQSHSFNNTATVSSIPKKINEEDAFIRACSRKSGVQYVTEQNRKLKLRKFFFTWRRITTDHKMSFYTVLNLIQSFHITACFMDKNLKD